jgi:hypothetical protein
VPLEYERALAAGVGIEKKMISLPGPASRVALTIAFASKIQPAILRRLPFSAQLFRLLACYSTFALFADLREEAMQKTPFFAPVCVSSTTDPAGHDIENLDQALQFLRDWPADRRGPVYQAAYNACCAAREGYLTVEEARKSLSGFARITGILQKDESPPAIAGSTERKSRHLTN